MNLIKVSIWSRDINTVRPHYEANFFDDCVISFDDLFERPKHFDRLVT